MAGENTAGPRNSSGPSEIYLDNSATTPMGDGPRQAMLEALDRVYGNPSSLHRKGLEAERLVKGARETIARVLGVEPAEMVFTSGGTEGNNLALRGAARALRRRGNHIITSSVEHSSVLSTCRDLAAEANMEVTELPVDGGGRVDPKHVEEALRPDTVLVSIMLVSHELGTIQPVEEIGRIVAGRRGDGRAPLFHIDAVQGLGKIPVKPRIAGADLLTVSAHKIHGPKGVGALYVRRGAPVRPLFTGGDQEGGLRPGTENVPGIAAMGAAAQEAELLRPGEESRIAGLRRRLIESVESAVPGAAVNGPRDGGVVPGIVSISFPGVKAETLVHALADKNIYVSTGSACHSRRTEVSHVLSAVGLPRERAEGTIRVSMSRDTEAGHLQALTDALADLVPKLRLITRM